MLTLFISSIYAINTDEFSKLGKEKALGAACKSKQGESACQAYNALKDPTGKLLGELGPQAQQLISGIQNPLGAGREAVMNKLMQSLQENSPELASAFNFYNTFQKYRGKIDGVFGDEEGKRYEPYYNEQTEEFGATKDGNPYFVATEGVNIIEAPESKITGAVTDSKIQIKEETKLETTEDKPKISFRCDANICKKVIADGFEVTNLMEGEMIEFSEDPKTGIKSFKVLKGEIDLKIKGKSVGEPKGEITNGEFRLKNDVLEYAKFNSVRDGKYTFDYNKIDYKFDVGKGGEVLFDPTKLQMGGKKLKFNINNKQLEGDFNIQFGSIGLTNIKDINFSANGKFIDTKNKLIATAPDKFVICLSGFTTTDKKTKGLKDKARCEGDNQIWINEESALTTINMRGKTKVAIGKYTTIDTTKNGATASYSIFPDRNDKFQVTDGAARIEKDHIATWVEYKRSKECKNLITSKIIAAFAAKGILKVEQNCGFYVSIDRTGIPSVLTQSLEIVDPDASQKGLKGYSIEITSTGMISAKDYKTGNAVDGDYKKYGGLFNNAKLLGAGEIITSKETQAAANIEGYIKHIDSQINNIEGKKWENVLLGLCVACTKEKDGFECCLTRKRKAMEELLKQKNDLNEALKRLKEGYSVEDSFEWKIIKNGKEQNIILGASQTFKESIYKINNDGSLNPEALSKLAREKSKECSGINEYLIVSCLSESELLKGLAKQELYRDNSILKNSKDKDTIFSEFTKDRQIGRFIDEDDELTILRGIDYMRKTADYYKNNSVTTVYKKNKAGNLVYEKGKTVVLYTPDDLIKEANRLEKIYKENNAFNELDAAEKELNNLPNKFKKILPFITEAGTIDEVVFVAGDISQLAKAYKAQKAFKVAKYSLAKKAISNLDNVAKEGSDLFKTLTRGDKALVKELEDIPEVAKVCL